MGMLHLKIKRKDGSTEERRRLRKKGIGTVEEIKKGKSWKNVKRAAKNK